MSKVIECPTHSNENPGTMEAIPSRDPLLTACEKLHPVLISILKGEASMQELIDAITGLEHGISDAGGAY